MLENPKVVRGSSVARFWIYPVLVPGIIYSMFRWFLPGGQYVMRDPEFLIILAAITIQVVYNTIKATANILSHDALRQAAARGDATRTETVIAVADTQVYHLPLQVSRTYSAKSIVIISFIFAIPSMVFLAVAWYFGHEKWIITNYLRSQLVLYFIVVLVMYLAAAIHGILVLLNSSRHTISADHQGLTIRRRWTKQCMRWQDVRLFLYDAPFTSSAPVPNAAAFTAVGAPLGSYELASAKCSVKISVESTSPCFAVPETYPTRLREILETAVRLSNVPLRQVSRAGILSAARQAPFAWARPSRPVRVRLMRFRRFCKKHNNMIALLVLPPLFLIPSTAIISNGWEYTLNTTAAPGQVMAIHPCMGKKEAVGTVKLDVQYLDLNGIHHTAQTPNCAVHDEQVGDQITIRYWTRNPDTLASPFDRESDRQLLNVVYGVDLCDFLLIVALLFWQRHKARLATLAKQQVPQSTLTS